MPVYLKKVKKELESDRNKVGKDKNGNFKFVPPSIIGRKVSQYPDLRTSKLNQIARPGIKALDYTAIVASENPKVSTEPEYKVTVQFFNMVFKEVESKQFSIKSQIGSTVAGGKKSFVYHRRPTFEKNPVKVKCQCLDFRHRFETQLAKSGGLIGGPRKYIRKTPVWPDGYPFANSTDKLGFCKHIKSLLSTLKEKGLVREQ